MMSEIFTNIILHDPLPCLSPLFYYDLTDNIVFNEFLLNIVLLHIHTHIYVIYIYIYIVHIHYTFITTTIYIYTYLHKL
jgi:hypothetical protein